jgi:hypothetical protein
MKIHIPLQGSDPHRIACSAVIAVPEAALSEPGHIRTASVSPAGQNKHELHAMAQMAFIQFDDGELDARSFPTPLVVDIDGNRMQIDNGVVIGRLLSGEIIILSNTRQGLRSFLETAHRYCTRWIRLDI